jgi:ribonuclease HI
MASNTTTINILQWNCRSISRKKPYLQCLLSTHDVKVFALSETHLSSPDDFCVPNFDIIRHDRDDGYGGVMLGIRKDIPFVETMKKSITNCELVGAMLKDEQGRDMNIISGYCPPNCRFNSVQIGSALRSLSGPLILVGDFNAHSRSWGCHDDSNRANEIFDLIDDLNLVIINDGSITRIATPPQRPSAIDLTLCSKYDIFINTLKNAVQHSQPIRNNRQNCVNAVKPIWWDVDCCRLDSERQTSFRVFRANGSSENYIKYTEFEERLGKLCERKQTDSWRDYCSSLSSRSRMSEVWKMAKKYRNPSRSESISFCPEKWLPAFADKIAPAFVAPEFIIPECSSRFNWLEEPFSADDLQAAIQLCNNSSPGLDLIKFIYLKNLPNNALLFLLQIFNDILYTGQCPSAWKETKVVSILKPGKPPNDANSYRPISLLSCVRKLFEKMLCIRMDFWAEKFEILSPSQFGFRKGKGTRDCLSILSTDIRISFEEKNSTLASFLDVTGAYDNILLNILCEKLCGVQLPFKIVRIIWSLLHEKDLVFFHDGVAYTRRIGLKGLPQGSVLSPLLFNLGGADLDTIIPKSISILQYADDIVIYISDKIIKKMQKMMQNALNGISKYFSDLGLTLSGSKSESVLFSRKSSEIAPPLFIEGRCMPSSKQFKYLGIIFDRGLTWNAHVGYIQKKCKTRINFMKSITGTSWGAHPDSMLILYKSLVRSVLEYGSFCFAEMAETHALKLKRIQWRGLRIALGLMQSTHTDTVEMLCGVVPLDLRFSYLNSKFLILTFSKINHPLKSKLKQLADLGSRKLTRDFATVDSLEVNLSESYTQFNLQALLSTPNIRDDVARSLVGFSKESYTTVAPLHFNSIIRNSFSESTLIYTDGSKSNNGTGFGVYAKDITQFGHRIVEPASVFSAELQAINYAIEYINTQPTGEFSILTDSLSAIEALKSRKISIKTHPIVHVIKDTLWRLKDNGYYIRLMWIPSHCNITGNEEADRIAKQSTLNSQFSRAKPVVFDFFPKLRDSMLSNWQQRWDTDEMGRYAYSIYPHVGLRPWFFGLEFDRSAITKISRLISNHTRVKSHLNRIKIVSEAICSCGDGYETIDHLLWHCSLHQAARVNLLQKIGSVAPSTSIRDILAQKKWDIVQACLSFLSSIIIL